MMVIFAKLLRAELVEKARVAGIARDVRRRKEDILVVAPKVEMGGLGI